MSKRYAVVNEKGHIVNVIIWDGVAKWSPLAGHLVICHDNCDIGDRWDTESKELIKICRINGCEHDSHGTEEERSSKILPDVHEEYRLPEHKE